MVKSFQVQVCTNQSVAVAYAHRIYVAKGMSWHSNNKRLLFLHYSHVGHWVGSAAILFGKGVHCIDGLVPRPCLGTRLGLNVKAKPNNQWKTKLIQ